MPFFNHVVILLSYVLVAGAITVTLPQHVPQIDPRVAGEIGGVLLLACSMIHFALSRLAHDRTVAAEIAALQAGYAQTRGELAGARDEARRIYEAIEAASQARQGQMADIGEVMTEVKVLQGLVEQLSGGKPIAVRKPVPVAASSGPVRTTGLPPPRVLTGLNEAEVLDIVREGLRNNRVDLFAQPIVSLPQRKHRHYECFSRIRGADQTMITPEQYLAIAEREGLIGAIDNMLLFRSIQLVRRIQKRENLGLFVNISEHTLADADFFREFVAFVAGNQDFAPKLIFEFAQTHVDRLGDGVMNELEQLARLGFRFSMDQVTHLDFDLDELGARYFRFIKIDAGKLLEQTRAPMQRLDMHAFKRALDRNGIDLIVEKIETEPMLLELLDLPIDYGQGYLFGEPRLAKDN